jgi:hypothetical protein
MGVATTTASGPVESTCTRRSRRLRNRCHSHKKWTSPGGSVRAVPDAPEERRRGRLANTDTGLELEIEGSLLPGPDLGPGPFERAAGSVRKDVIHGRQRGYGNPVTALACVGEEPWLPTEMHDPVSSTTDWTVGAIVLGAHLTSKDDTVIGLTWQVPALDEWVPDEDMTHSWTEEKASGTATVRRQAG